jgi:flagellar basal body-associated protein FliL
MGSRGIRITAVVCALAVLGLLAYTYREDLSIPSLVARFTSGGALSVVSIPCVVNYESKVLRLSLSVTCRDKDQRSEVKEKIPRIQHALINTLCQPAAIDKVMDRDMDWVREHAAGTINAQMSSPVKGVYLDAFFLD